MLAWAAAELRRRRPGAPPEVVILESKWQAEPAERNGQHREAEWFFIFE
jgi:hypothetical protein